MAFIISRHSSRTLGSAPIFDAGHDMNVVFHYFERHVMHIMLVKGYCLCVRSSTSNSSVTLGIFADFADFHSGALEMIAGVKTVQCSIS